MTEWILGRQTSHDLLARIETNVQHGVATLIHENSLVSLEHEETLNDEMFKRQKRERANGAQSLLRYAHTRVEKSS